MGAATQRLADTDKALNRRFDDSARLVQEHQTGESEDDQRRFLILGDLEARIAAKSVARNKRRSGSRSGSVIGGDDGEESDDGVL
ncbi:hypothetical protein GcC1_132017 [Golovinomyces cichoracearum]|uniref:Uncharacterized protein n=1 Tax=Golovinomyces cichoracearum TaxID=62708 RepID=A0A420I437_9PEZI|nr:hypothetical protein GcC1_132017 [Golovinomyces cichoracearum]